MKNNNQQELSPAVKFLDAFVAAMPRGTSYHAYSVAMHDAMDLAVRNRFQFKVEDAAELKRFCFNSNSGVFGPLETRYYTLACVVGGTYARMWEKSTGMRPWVAKRALGRTSHREQWEKLEDSRVAPGMAVLVPVAQEDDEPELARIQGDQVWWCTSFSDGFVMLCRYRYYERKGGYLDPYETTGAPIRKRKITRAEWEAFQGQTAASPATEKAAA